MDWNLIITTALSLITILIVVYWSKKQYQQLQDQLSSNFFAEYTKRYQEIILNLPIDIEKKGFDLNNLDKAEKDKTIHYIRVYFDLCSEQHYLKEKKRIDDDTWNEWKEGMQHYFSNPLFSYVWKEYYQYSEYFNDFKRFVETELIPG